MLRTALLWAATGVVLVWAWLFFEGIWAPTEIVAAACAGAIGATAALVVRRAAHSGVVTDYVTWLVVGAAGLGGIFALTLTS
jgi:hypothetical protein